MTLPSWPDHPMTLADWTALPEDDRYVLDVVEGVLRMSPRPYTFHQRAIAKIVARLNDQLPESRCALGEVEMVVDEAPLTLRIPDVIVVSTELADTNPARYAAVDVALAVEVHSEGTVRTDRVMKFAEYSEAGVPAYWMVDLSEPTSLIAYHLVGDHYESQGEFTHRASVPLGDWTLDIDLDGLTSR
ncbi:Uma2 family endonuclease [Smaragdicoccus niigatensis]|uniref:Uma2 family endonuclease n=1 Tax=Smaragdicoccus niigatensis TaxID=359359 RepID=UPI00039C2F9E|nr:Uma2 family endonuclease [Smaragdicoccus niigatensis]